LVLSEHPFISCLFGLATHKVYHAMFITKHPVSSYLAFSPFPNCKQLGSLIFCGTFCSLTKD